jgi:hypothetical protein
MPPLRARAPPSTRWGGAWVARGQGGDHGMTRAHARHLARPQADQAGRDVDARTWPLVAPQSVRRVMTPAE